MNADHTTRDELKDKLTKKILESIPPNIKSTDYLMDILELGRESVYRRLKGDIAFTLKEIMVLSSNLGFSVDELLAETNPERAIFGLTKKETHSSLQGFQAVHKFYHDYAFDMYQSQTKSFEISLNRILCFFVADKDTLFKFFYYKWVHQFDKVSLNYSMSDVDVPEDVKDLCKKTQHYIKYIDTTLILDPNIFYYFFHEIKYFQERRLITDEEVTQMTEEFREMLREMETVVLSGSNDLGGQWYVYISPLRVENNSSYMVCDNRVLSSLDIHSGSNMYSYDRQFCSMHKAWLDSMKKYSMLISNCNEKMQAEFFNQQYRYLDEFF